MNIQNYSKVQKLVGEINELEYELKNVNEALNNADGLLTVKINTKWIINIPAQTMKGHIQARKQELERQISDKKTEIENL